jgi:hypothetical protein
MPSSLNAFECAENDADQENNAKSHAMNPNNMPFHGRRIEQQVMGHATRDGDGVKLTRVLT